MSHFAQSLVPVSIRLEINISNIATDERIFPPYSGRIDLALFFLFQVKYFCWYQPNLEVLLLLLLHLMQNKGRNYKAVVGSDFVVSLVMLAPPKILRQTNNLSGEMCR